MKSLSFTLLSFQETESPAGFCYEPVKMTEVADMTVPDHRVATVRHYEAGPPPGLELVSTVLFTLYNLSTLLPIWGKREQAVRPTLFYAEESKRALYNSSAE